MSLKIFSKRFNLLFHTNAGIYNITEHKVPFQNLQKGLLNRSGFKKKIQSSVLI